MAGKERGKEKQDGPIMMTQFTLDFLKSERARLEAELSRIGAGAEGDMRASQHDDPGTQQTKDQIGSRLGPIVGYLSAAEIVIIKPRKETETVGIGNQVSLDWGDGLPETVLLLSRVDSEFATNMPLAEGVASVASFEGPLGKAILGKKPGDSVTYPGPGKQITVEIVAIEPGNF